VAQWRKRLLVVALLWNAHSRDDAWHCLCNFTGLKSAEFGGTNMKVWWKRTLVACVLMVIAAGWLIAAKPVKHEFNAQLTIVAAQKGKANAADPLDSLDLPSVKIPFDVQQKQVSSNFAWSGRTKKGRAVSWQLSGPGSVNSELASGKLELDLPFTLTVDGKKFPVRVKFTTESVSDSLGSASGRRATLQGPLAQSVELVAGSEFTAARKDLDAKSTEPGQQSIVVRVQAKGQIRALEGTSLFDREPARQ
jgi:hypothetical protein